MFHACESYREFYCVIGVLIFFFPKKKLLQPYFRGAIDDMAAKSLRCVAFAYKPYDRNNVPTTNEEELAQWSLPEDSLILLAIVGIKVLK